MRRRGANIGYCLYNLSSQHEEVGGCFGVGFYWFKLRQGVEPRQQEIDSEFNLGAEVFIDWVRESYSTEAKDLSQRRAVL